MSLRTVLCLGMLCLAPFISFGANAEGKHVVKVNGFFDPNNMANPHTKQLAALMKRDPSIHIQPWSGIMLPGGKSGLMMSIAGKTAPDITDSWFHLIRNDIKQGFLYPLNEWIGEDLNCDGKVEGREVKWKRWNEISPILRKVVTVRDPKTGKGMIYGLPQPGRSISAIIFRTDMVESAGLDPANPPQTWEELLYWCRRLTNTQKIIPGAITQNGQCGILLPESGWQFLPWIQSAGGEPVVQSRTSPVTGKSYDFAMNEVNFIAPDTRENLNGVESEWRLNFNSYEAAIALDFIYKLRWGKWILNDDNEPVDFTDELLRKYEEDGYEHTFEGSLEKLVKGDKVVLVNKGCARRISGQRGEGTGELLERGEVVMILGGATDIDKMTNPDNLSWFPYPAASKELAAHPSRIIQTQNHFAVMYPGVADRPKAERDACWKVLTTICDDNIHDEAIRSQVLSGMARFVPPDDLERLGFSEYVVDIPLALRRTYEEINRGNRAMDNRLTKDDKGKKMVLSYTEPWIGFWFLIDTRFAREVSGPLLGSRGETFDYHGAMLELNKKANSGLMFDTPESELRKWRPVAFVIMVVVVILMVGLIFFIIKSFWKKRTEGSRSVYKGYLPLLLILPAVLLIAVWSYYPLCRGLLMAFQDYKVTGDCTWVRLDNFINLCLDKSFWMSLARTCYFVFLNMLLAFTAPIILAILLTEIRHLKIFYRTLFFLPQMTSGLVIALMWKLMYNPTPAGFFNQMLSYLKCIGINVKTQTWLEDPSLAMICCIIPTVWASMGMSSLLYLAALHSIPPDLYEAADVDGAGFRSKLWNITLPTLLPLIIISFVGTFIGTFQNMGNIFLMTFGGPGEATTVIGLKIWQEAYVNLRFGMATAMACMLGSLLIGLTYVQIKFLSKVEYKRAAD